MCVEGFDSAGVVWRVLSECMSSVSVVCVCVSVCVAKSVSYVVCSLLTNVAVGVFTKSLVGCTFVNRIALKIWKPKTIPMEVLRPGRVRVTTNRNTPWDFCLVHSQAYFFIALWLDKAFFPGELSARRRHFIDVH